MIDLKEIRISNKVLVNDTISTILTIEEKGCYIQEDRMLIEKFVEYKDMDPIRLNDYNLVEMAGFKTLDYIHFYMKGMKIFKPA